MKDLIDIIEALSIVAEFILHVIDLWDKFKNKKK